MFYKEHSGPRVEVMRVVTFIVLNKPWGTFDQNMRIQLKFQQGAQSIQDAHCNDNLSYECLVFRGKSHLIM